MAKEKNEGGAKAPLDTEEQPPEEQPKPAAVVKGKKDQVYVIKHPSVSQDATSSFYLEGREMTIKVKSGFHETSDKRIFDLLTSEGWEDKTEYPVNTQKVEPERIPRVWHFKHPLPDSVKDSRIGMYDENGFETQVDLKDGKVAVKSLFIAKNLEAAGYILEKTEK